MKTLDFVNGAIYNYHGIPSIWSAKRNIQGKRGRGLMCMWLEWQTMESKLGVEKNWGQLKTTIWSPLTSCLLIVSAWVVLGQSCHGWDHSYWVAYWAWTSKMIHSPAVSWCWLKPGSSAGHIDRSTSQRPSGGLDFSRMAARFYKADL